MRENLITMQVNINGIKNKLEELKLLIHDTHADIITIQETKLTPKAKHPKYITSQQCAPTGCTRRWAVVIVVYPLPWPLLVGGGRCSRLWSTSQLLRPSGQQCSHSGGVCPQIQGRQCGAYVGAVEEMMCVVCVDVTEGA